MKIDLLSQSKEYLDFIRVKPCLICGVYGVDAHHMEEIGTGNNSKKLSFRHFSAIPLCRVHHTLYHSPGITTFEVQFAPPGKRLHLYREALSLFLEWQSGISNPFHNDKGKR